MEVEKLEYLAQALRDVLQQENRQQLIQQFVAQANQLVQQPNAQSVNNLRNALSQLSSSGWIDFEEWELDGQQREVLSRLGADLVLTEAGGNQLRERVEGNATNPRRLGQLLQEDAQQIGQLANWAQQLSTLLPMSMPSSSAYTPSDDERIVRFHFRKDAGLTDFGALADWSAKFKRAFMAFDRLVGRSPEDVRVVGVRPGSVVIEVAASAATAIAIIKAVDLVLQVAERLMSLYRNWVELKHLRASPGVVDGLKQDHENASEAEVKKIVVVLQHEYPMDGEDREEIRSAVGLATRDLLSFVEKGGEVLLLQHGATDDELSLIESAKTHYPSLRKIENRVQQLELLSEGEHAPDDETESPGESF